MLGSAAGAGAMSPLSSKLAGHAVIAATLTGLGERAHLLSPQIGLDTHASDIVGVLRCRDLNGVVLVGHSYGGPVITTVAERMPDRIRWARLQPRQLPAHAYSARSDQAVVADHAAQPAVKIGAKIVRHGRSVIFQMTEVAVPRALFQTVLGAITALRPLPLA